MEQRSKDAAVMDAQIELPEEECASGMEQRSHENDAAVKDAPMIHRMAEYVLSTEQR